MCGRYSMTEQGWAFEPTLNTRVEIGPWINQLRLLIDEQPRYNIAPSQTASVVTSDAPNELQQMRWGFIPSWSKLGLKQRPQPINARMETVATSGMFRRAFSSRRCLVPADGYYEWRKTADGKQPMRIVPAEEDPWCFAGIWETWTSPEGERIHTYTIITTTANESLAHIHDRMPVILTPDRWGDWLDADAQPADAQQLLRPLDDDAAHAYEVSTVVNSPRNAGPECIAPMQR